MPDNPRDYDKMAPPKGGDDPTTVLVHVTVMSLDSIDESSMKPLKTIDRIMKTSLPSKQRRRIEGDREQKNDVREMKNE
ncbi:hypothetical protein E2C01_069553 [Portunus trituberculatus]|uniref:Uncharacterized protein n=1 Tax=Portunus trituberculatus TaxID=210409 RepID=A0A5B7HZW0_PORTR|nr:hypothetical protein [Portunus trituberculatus]